jgi:hypothetical protein
VERAVSSLHTKLDENTAALKAVNDFLSSQWSSGGIPPSTGGITHVSESLAKGQSIRSPPAPLFSGTKENCKIHTWLAQFVDYCRILRIAPDQMTSYASLCLKDKAAEHWANMKRALAQVGKDPNDFEVFRLAMLEHYVDLSVESTVRSRLSKLKQVHSVAEFHAKFRDIMVEAILHPLSGPEACSLFRAGLKKPIFETLMRDPVVRNEQASLEVVVRAAKEAEALLSMLAGNNNSEDTARSPHRPRHRHAGHQAKPRGMPTFNTSLSGPPAKKMRTDAPPEGQVTQVQARGVSSSLANYRWRVNKCLNCGKDGHNMDTCRNPTYIPSTKGSSTHTTR